MTRPDLIETFAYRPGAGLVRIDLHLARLARSARALGYEYRPDQAASLLAEIAGDTPKRCRLTLTPQGAFDLAVVGLPANPAAWTIAISPVVMRSDDPWLGHKTTHRAIYDTARADLPKGLDEWVFLNEQGDVTEGTITNIVVTLADGERVTPPLVSGVLPGVYRAQLLGAGDISERVIRPADLATARAIHMVNSLRGEIPAQLAPGHI